MHAGLQCVGGSSVVVLQCGLRKYMCLMQYNIPPNYTLNVPFRTTRTNWSRRNSSVWWAATTRWTIISIGWLVRKNKLNNILHIFAILLFSRPDEIGTPSAPALVADSLTATSLSLEWEIPERVIALSHGQSSLLKSYLVQWRYEEIANDWKFCRNQSIGTNSTVRVDNLQPYTKYRVSPNIIYWESVYT